MQAQGYCGYFVRRHHGHLPQNVCGVGQDWSIGRGRAQRSYGMPVEQYGNDWSEGPVVVIHRPLAPSGVSGFGIVCDVQQG